MSGSELGSSNCGDNSERCPPGHVRITALDRSALQVPQRHSKPYKDTERGPPAGTYPWWQWARHRCTFWRWRTLLKGGTLPIAMSADGGIDAHSQRNLRPQSQSVLSRCSAGIPSLEINSDRGVTLLRGTPSHAVVGYKRRPRSQIRFRVPRAPSLTRPDPLTMAWVLLELVLQFCRHFKSYSQSQHNIPPWYF